MSEFVKGNGPWHTGLNTCSCCYWLGREHTGCQFIDPGTFSVNGGHIVNETTAVAKKEVNEIKRESVVVVEQ